MTIYEIKLNKCETVRTTQLNEARNIAKQILADKVVAAKQRAEYYNRNSPMPYNPCLTSVREKMYIRKDEIEYCFYASVSEQRGVRKNYRVTIKVKNVFTYGYDFDLHKDIINRVAQKEQVNIEQGAE